MARGKNGRCKLWTTEAYGLIYFHLFCIPIDGYLIVPPFDQWRRKVFKVFMGYMIHGTWGTWLVKGSIDIPHREARLQNLKAPPAKLRGFWRLNQRLHGNCHFHVPLPKRDAPSSGIWVGNCASAASAPDWQELYNDLGG